ncbi:MAG: START-like domain-containing protein [Prevotellaceae bacterium]|nr:START-like domain-containing protein [Prevotellaceae bacterium]
MSKTKIVVEYPLNSKSASIVWGLIGNAHGLGKWIADYVDENDGVLTFKWGEVWTQQDIRTSKIIEIRENSHIRLKWDVNVSDEDYWELRIEKSDFSGNINLIITDHVNDDDVDYMRGVWDDNIERLHRVSGL